MTKFAGKSSFLEVEAKLPDPILTRCLPSFSVPTVCINFIETAAPIVSTVTDAHVRMVLGIAYKPL